MIANMQQIAADRKLPVVLASNRPSVVRDLERRDVLWLAHLVPRLVTVKHIILHSYFGMKITRQCGG